MPEQPAPALVPINRFINFIKILFSYGASLISRRSWHTGMPAALSVEPTDLCNLRCPECPAGRHELDRPKGLMPAGLFRQVLDQAEPYSAYLTLYFQGEPYLNPAFFDMIREARSRRLFTVTSTNGHFLDDHNARETVSSGLNRIIISLDGADQQSYSAYRTGGDFERVVTGIRTLSAVRKEMRSSHPELVLQCLVLRSNENQLGSIKALGKELGADRVVFKTAQFYEFEEGNPLMPVMGRRSRYRLVKSPSHRVTGSPGQQVTGSGVYRIKNPLRNHCFRMWSSCVVTWDGKVVPCCFDKDAQHEMGDLKSQSLREIWEGEKYREFRRRLLNDRKSIDICRNCTQKF